MTCLCSKPLHLLQGAESCRAGREEGRHWICIDTDTCAVSLTKSTEIRFQDVDPGVKTLEIRMLEMKAKRSRTHMLALSPLPPPACCPSWVQMSDNYISSPGLEASVGRPP